MNFGIRIDNDFVHRLPDYKHKPKNEITAKDRSDVALQQIDVYKREATKRLDELKDDYGSGVSTLIRIYNATGDQITVWDSVSFKGHYFKATPTQTVANGQWTTFVHVHPTISPVGCAGAVIYRDASDTLDFFIGWQDPWMAGYDPTCFCEVHTKGYWWDQCSQNYMNEQLYRDWSSHRHENIREGYKITADIGDSMTSYCEAVISMA